MKCIIYTNGQVEYRHFDAPVFLTHIALVDDQFSTDNVPEMPLALVVRLDEYGDPLVVAVPPDAKANAACEQSK